MNFFQLGPSPLERICLGGYSISLSEPRPITFDTHFLDRSIFRTLLDRPPTWLCLSILSCSSCSCICLLGQFFRLVFPLPRILAFTLTLCYRGRWIIAPYYLESLFGILFNQAKDGSDIDPAEFGSSKLGSVVFSVIAMLDESAWSSWVEVRAWPRGV